MGGSIKGVVKVETAQIHVDKPILKKQVITK